MRMEVEFPGNKKVQANFKDFSVLTDQPVRYGGDGEAPEPFQFFLASLLTCAGFYVLAFCNKRNISMDGIKIIQEAIAGPVKGQLGTIKLDIIVPSSFPEKYRNALIGAVNACTVKRTILNPPEFEVVVGEQD